MGRSGDDSAGGLEQFSQRSWQHEAACGATVALPGLFSISGTTVSSTVWVRGLPRPARNRTGGWIACIKRKILGVNAVKPMPWEQIA